MGTWGPGVFEDDTALDAAAEFRELIAQGLSPEAATARVLGEMDVSDGFGEQPSLWFGLASEQVKLGRLVEAVKAKALELIDSGADLEAWEEDADFLRERAKALAELTEQLTGDRGRVEADVEELIQSRGVAPRADAAGVVKTESWLSRLLRRLRGG